MEIELADIEPEPSNQEGVDQQELQQALPHANPGRSLRELLEEPTTPHSSSGRSLHELLEEPTTPLRAQADLSGTLKRRSGGWKAMPYILGNDTLERLATFGLGANFMVYLMRELHLSQVSASNVLNISGGVTSFFPLLGAFISDAYIGRFRTIAFSSISSLVGMAMLTLSAWLPTLHPPPCNPVQLKLGQCVAPSTSHMAFLILSLGFVALGSGGVRPCSVPFGVDQFDPTTNEGRKGIKSFFNWYFATYNCVFLIIFTLVVYIQDKISWTVGFGIPTLLMACSIVLFFIGTNVYVHVKPQGSIFTSIVRVLVAAHKKRYLRLPNFDNFRENDESKFYHPPTDRSLMAKLTLTNQFRSLDKAAMIEDNDLKSDGSPTNPWRLCSVQQVEELKCLIKTLPIWVSAIFINMIMSQQGIFLISQALEVNLHLGHKFEIPAASLGVISMLTIAIFLPIYDKLLVPALKRITKAEGGISVLQRIGTGIVFSVLAMVVAGFIEYYRREMVNSHPQYHFSFLWLSPQLVLMGLCEMCSLVGLIEFFNQEFPDGMRSVGFALLSCASALSSYLCSLLVNVIHHVTATKSKPDWLTKDINSGRLDLLYYLLAGIAFLNFIYFLFVSRRYHYTEILVHKDDNVELGATGSIA